MYKFGVTIHFICLYFVWAAEKITAPVMDKLRCFVCQVVAAGSIPEDKRLGLDIYQQIGIYLVICGVVVDVYLLSTLEGWGDLNRYEIHTVEMAKWFSIFIATGFIFISGIVRDIVNYLSEGC